MFIVDTWGSANCKEVLENGAPTVFLPTLHMILQQHHSKRHQQHLDLTLTKMICDEFYFILSLKKQYIYLYIYLKIILHNLDFF